MSTFAALRRIAQVISSHPRSWGWQAATWLRFASWVVSSRLQREHTEFWIEGQRLIVRRGMTGATGNVYLCLHEFMSMMLTLYFLWREDLFIDVDAMSGPIPCSPRITHARTWAFEPDEIKVDVEGYEEPVVLGARKTLVNPALKVISLESTSPVILQLLADNRFDRAFYDPFTRKLTREPNRFAYADGKWTLSNEFYVRDWPFVEIRLATARSIEVFGRRI